MLEVISEYHEWLKVGRSPLIDSWPLFHSPIPIVTIMCSYIAFVLYLGPKWMENRKPFNLKYIIIFYNAFQVYQNYTILSTAMMESSFWKYLFGFGCVNLSDAEEKHYQYNLYICFWHVTMNKILDLLDTVFFVLCKKQSHITFLHVQHHVAAVAVLWTFGKYFTGHELTIAFICNLTVHMIMYFYYLIAALGPKFKRFLWWKKYLTLIQIIQFFIIILYMLVSLQISCGYNTKIVKLTILEAFINLVLFMNFYFKTYDSKKLIEQKMAVCGSLQINQDWSDNQNNNKDK